MRFATNIKKNGHHTIMLAIALLLSGCGNNQDEDSIIQRISSVFKIFSQEDEREKERKEIEEKKVRWEKIKEIAQQRLEQELEKEPVFDLETEKKALLLEKYSVDLRYIPQERKEIEEVEKILAQRAMQESLSVFSEEKKRQVKEQAEKEFHLYKVGEFVELSTFRGPIYGLLERIYPEKIKVGKFYILLQDISLPDPACFNEKICQRRRKHFMNIYFDIPKDDFFQERKKELEVIIYKQEGYVSFKEEWVPVEEIIEQKIVPILKVREKAYNDNLKKKIKIRVEAKMKKEGLF